jgi:hypothetical protein
MTTTAQIRTYGASISEGDEDGVGDVCLRVLWDFGHEDKAWAAVRLIVVACNLGGGIERAIELIRAETVRQQEAS